MVRIRQSAALVLALALAGPMLSMPVHGAVLAADGEDDAVSTLGGCLVAEKAGDVLLLLDQSASLQDSDPEGARVDSAIYLTESLASFAQRNGVDLSMAVAGFDVGYTKRSDWESVGDGADGTVAALTAMGAADTGWETDYWNALEGARQAMRDQAADKGGSRCQAVVWFSDGSFELDTRSTRQERRDYGTTKPYAGSLELTADDSVREAESRGRGSLCRGGGLADQLRASDVRLLSVGLQGSGKPRDFAFMRSVATGMAPGGDNCGDIQGPDVGSFTLASDINQLLLSFDQFGAPDQPPVTTTRPPCRTSGCPQGLHSVVLDSSIRRARILAASDLKSANIELLAPGVSEPLKLTAGESGSSRIGTTDVTWRWVSPTAAEITLVPESQTDPTWSGVWSVAFVDPKAPPDAETQTNIHVEGDLAPALVASPSEWRVGTTLDGVEFGLARRGSEDQVSPEDVVSDVSFGAQLELPGGQRLDLLDDVPADSLSEPISIDLAGAGPGQSFLTMKLDVTTAAAKGPNGETVAGTTLSPQTVRLPVELLPPLDFPTVATAVDFGTTEGTGPLTVDLPITGPGCVWLDNVDLVTSPQEVGDVTVTTPSATTAETCLRLQEEEAASLPLALTVASPGNGAVTGTLDLMIAPAEDPSRAVAQSVDFLADMRKPVNATVRLGLTALLVVLGTIVPLAILWFVAWWQSRIPGEGLRVAQVDIEHRAGLAVRPGAPGALALQPSELPFVGVSPPGQRKVALPSGGMTLRASVRNPLNPHVVVDAPDRVVCVTSTGGRTLDLVVGGTWTLLKDSGDRHSLLIVLSDIASDQQRAELLSEAQTGATDWYTKHPSSTGEQLGEDDPWGAPSTTEWPTDTSPSQPEGGADWSGRGGETGHTGPSGSPDAPGDPSRGADDDRW